MLNSEYTPLGLRNVQFDHADGGMGWPERGPFDGIIATAAPERIPEELLLQLATGGRLVIPVGGDTQHLQVVTRTHEGYETEIVESVYFVPLYFLFRFLVLLILHSRLIMGFFRRGQS